MATCFVIQPFDGGPFDKRYEDVFVPAIQAAGLEPYRVDRDPAVTVPIDEIEAGIRKAEVCLADISTPNPNVWFELGYAIAAGKQVVLVCAYDPVRRFPFDVQHRSVITYRTESARDFNDLEGQISAKLQAALSKEDRLERFAEASVVAEVKGLNQIEIVALVTVAENAEDPDSAVSTWSIRHDMERSGYTRLAVTLALTTLLSKGMVAAIRTVTNSRRIGLPIPACSGYSRTKSVSCSSANVRRTHRLMTSRSKDLHNERAPKFTALCDPPRVSAMPSGGGAANAAVE